MAASGMAPAGRVYNTVSLAAAAGADVETAVFVAPFAGTVTKVAYVTRVAITGANTESRTCSVLNKLATGLGTASVASKAFVNGVDTVAYAETVITLSATPANLAFAAGDVLTFKSLHIGSTGLADPGGTVFITVARD